MIPFSCPCCEVPHPPHREGCTLWDDGEELAADFDEVSSLRAEVARLREERLTDEERDAVAGIALVLGRLKIYPEQVGRTKQNDLDLLWRIAGEREMGE